MKKINSLLQVSLILLTACGAQTPFRRGPDVVVSVAGNSQKPVISGNANQPTDTPTDAPTEPTDVDKAYFESVLYPVLQKRCTICHDDKVGNFDSAKKMIVFKKPEESKIYLVSTGRAFSHRQIFKPDSAEAISLVTWINGGKAL